MNFGLEHAGVSGIPCATRVDELQGVPIENGAGHAISRVGNPNNSTPIAFFLLRGRRLAGIEVYVNHRKLNTPAWQRVSLSA
jgi:hypothetical protein